MRFCLALLLLLAGPAFALPRVLIMLPDDFMWPEYAEQRALYDKEGFQVRVAGKKPGPIHPDTRNGQQPVNADLTFDQVHVDDYDAVTFVGGNGAWHDFFPNATAHAVLRDCMKKRKRVGLICAATGLLALVDNLDGDGQPLAAGRRVVGYFRVAGMLKKLGHVDYVGGGDKEPGVAVDGNLVTGRNPESSQLFGEKMVELLKQGQ